MINIHEVLETNEMIEKENLDVRTITLGISLLNCIDTDVDRLCERSEGASCRERVSDVV